MTNEIESQESICFPHCSYFKKDVISQQFYCVYCGINEKNVREYKDWDEDDKRN